MSYEYKKVLNEMYYVYVESNLASPLPGSAILEISPEDTVRKVISNFLLSPVNNDIPGIAAFDKFYNRLEWDSTVKSQGLKDESRLYLVYDESSNFQPGHITVIGIAAIFIAILVFITTFVIFGTTGGDIPFDYGIVIDAGSTHTEVFLYQWCGSKFHGTGEVFQKDFCRIEDGIAKGCDPADIVSCVNNITRTLPKDLSSPVIYLGATAGMRLLNISNPLDAHLILTTIKYALKTTNVQEGSIEIIQGEDEGIFSWITANFLSKTLQNYRVNATYGALDLGGASTQLAFALEPDLVRNLTDIKVMKLYGFKYYVMSKSFLCFGLSEASDRSKAVTFIDSFNKTLIAPCLPKDYSMTLKTKDFFIKPCLKSNIIQRLITSHKIEEMTFQGSSNFSQCREVVKKLIDPVSCQKMGFKQCLQVMHIADEHRKFMAFSSFYYIVNSVSPNGSLEEFVEATRDFCSLSFDQLKARAHNQSELFHLLTYCFGAVYVAELLGSNYGFNNTTWKNILFEQNIKKTDVGWSLGFMINASNAIPEEATTPPIIGLNILIPLLSISCLMTFFAAILFRKKFKLKLEIETETLLESGS